MYDNGSDFTVFYKLWGDCNICNCFFRISKSSGLSGGGDYAAGIWAAQGKIPFVVALLITIAAGLLGSLLLYYLGYKGGELFLQKCLNKFPKQKPLIEEKLKWIREKGCVGIFVSKLIPMVRTLVSIPAGVSRMNLLKYAVSSALGISIWNLFFVGAGYLLGESVFAYLGWA